MKNEAGTPGVALALTPPPPPLLPQDLVPEIARNASRAPGIVLVLVLEIGAVMITAGAGVVTGAATRNGQVTGRRKAAVVGHPLLIAHQRMFRFRESDRNRQSQKMTHRRLRLPN